jgi:hypothetical protein
MADLMSMLSNLFGSQNQTPELPSAAAPQPPLAAGLANRDMTHAQAGGAIDPLGGDMLRPGGPMSGMAQGGGMIDSLRTALGDKLGGFASEIAKGWDDAGRHLSNERAGAMDPENAGLARSINRGAAMPQPGPTPGPLTPGPGQVINDGLPDANNVGGGMAAQLRQSLLGGGPAPGGAPAGPAGPGGMQRPPMGVGGPPPGAPAVGGPWQTTAKPTGPLGGMLDNIGLKDVQDFIRHVSTGVAGANPKTSMLQAMAQGAAGSSTAAQKDAELAEGKATKADDRNFDRKMKTDEFGLKKNADERAGKREANNERVSEARAQYLQARAAAALRKDGTLDNKDISSINAHMERWARRNKDSMAPADFDKAFETEYARQREQYTQKKVVTPGEAKGVAAPPPAPPAPGDVRNGYRYKGGPLNDQSSWEKAQ